MVWWVEGFQISPDMLCGGDYNNFKRTLQYATLFLILSPFVVFGTWVAAYSYQGHSSHKVGDLIRLIYNFVFASFRGLGIQLPAFTFDISTVREAYNKFKDADFAFPDYAPKDFIAASGALTALNFALSITKLAINVLGVISAWSEFAVDYCSLPFSDISIATTDLEAAWVVHKTIEQRKKKVKDLADLKKTNKAAWESLKE
jgi:hypothetical protein